jgi:hypothetical protein
MRPVTVTILLGTAALIGGVALWSIGGHARDSKRQNLAADATGAPNTNTEVTVVHRHVVVTDVKERGPALPQEPPKMDPVRELQERFAAVPVDRPTESRNETVLRSLFEKTGNGKPPRIDSFSCRGPSCQAVFTFESPDQILATFNVLPDQEEWKRAGLGFNAIPEDPDDPGCLRFTVFFTSAMRS